MIKPVLCYTCKTPLTFENASPSRIKQGRGECRNCMKLWERKRNNRKPLNSQVPGGYHTFSSCGCQGYLPENRGKSNLFAHACGKNWNCRAGEILAGNSLHAKHRGYAPPADTPHSVIRKLMEETICERCGDPMKWELGNGKTPHLHHDHATGEIYGFTHPHCNPLAMQRQLESFKKEIARLKQRLEEEIL